MIEKQNSLLMLVNFWEIVSIPDKFQLILTDSRECEYS